MKINFILFVITFFIFSQGFTQSKISPYLFERIQKSLEDGSRVNAMVFLEDQVDIEELDRQLTAEKATADERAYTVITTLQEKAKSTQIELLNFLASKDTSEVFSFDSYWISNFVSIEAMPGILIELSKREDVGFMDFDYQSIKDPTFDERSAPRSLTNSSEPGLRVVNAHKLWALGYSGNGRLVMNIDTGVDGNHPALSSRWRGTHVPYNQAWYGPGTYPTDNDGHGTHTMGTITGLDAATNDTVGVAPNAEWIAAATIGTGYSASAAFQWALDPDGNPSTTDDMPDVISNSWYINPIGGCLINTWGPLLNSVEAAGIAVVFSAGNEGPGAQTITGPKNINTNLVNVWATGNINGNSLYLPIASSSSRGPSGCGGTGSLLIKPEAVAPGSSVRSSLPGGGYGFLSGTSMACPHVAGAIALLKEAFPTKTGHELKLALYYTAKETPADLAANDPGEEVGETSGEDHTYGKGVIDVYAAYEYLMYGPAPNGPRNLVAYSDYSTPNSMTLTWQDPSTVITGDPLGTGDFHIYILRDSALVDSVPGGSGQYVDFGLNDGQEYHYSIYARMDSSGASSIWAETDWIAGGSPIPQMPTEVEIFGNQNSISVFFRTPSRNMDGTPMDDLAGINLYRDSVLVETLPMTSADTGMVNSLQYNLSQPGYYYWSVTAFDNESPVKESAFTEPLRNPIGLNFVDYFIDPGVPTNMFWYNEKAEVNDRGVNPPSGPFSLNLNGTGIPIGDDLIESYPIDLSTYQGSNVHLSFMYQRGGQGDPPLPTDSMNIYLLNNMNEWIRIKSYVGNSISEPFIVEIINLDTLFSGSGTYFFSGFKIRFEVNGRSHAILPVADWFIDNIYLGLPAPYLAISQDSIIFDTTAVGETDTMAIEIQNVGLQEFTVQNIISPGGIFTVDRTNFPVGANSHEIVNFVFSPPTAGNFAGIASIVHNALNLDTVKISMIGTTGTPSGIDDIVNLPKTYKVSQNYPNPFNPSTTIKYQLPQTSDVQLQIFNVLGQKVRTLLNSKVEAGYHEAIWDGRNDLGHQVASGIYIYKFQAGNFQKTLKLMLLK